MPPASKPETHIPDSAYVFLIESVIFCLLLLGVLNMDGMPVLPTLVMLGLLLCTINIGCGILGVKTGVVVNPHVLAGNGASIVLSFIQVALQHAFGLVGNLALFLVTLASDTGDAADAYFAIFFRAKISEPDMWYLSRSAGIVLLGISLALFCLLIACFGSIRGSIPAINQRRAHFMGYFNSFIFLNIAWQFVMKAANVRVCQREYPCALSSFTEDPSIDVAMHIQVGVAVGCVFAADFLSELAFGKMLSREHGRTSGFGGFFFLFVYVAARASMLIGIMVFYILVPEDGADDLFPTWFNILLPIVYGCGFAAESVAGVTEAIAVHRSRASIHMDREEDNKMSQSSNFSMPSVFLGTAQRKTILRSQKVLKKVQ